MQLNSIKKIQLFTHNDLDGMGCAIMVKSFFKGADIDIEICGYDDLNEKINTFLNSGAYNSYDAVYIMDLSVTEEAIVKKLEDINKLNILKDLKIIDHHLSSDYIKNYSIGIINTCDKNKESATLLAYKYLSEKFKDISNISILKNFAENVSDYDTFTWIDNDNEFAEMLNVDLFNKVPNKEDNEFFNYIEYMTKRIENGDSLIDNKDYPAIEKFIEERTVFISRKNKLITTIKTDGFNIGVVYVKDDQTKHNSIMGNVLCKSNPYLDFIAIISLPKGKMSFRANKDGINLDTYAKKFNGGGHRKAAGGLVHNMHEILSSPKFTHILDAVNSDLDKIAIQDFKDLTKVIFL